MSTLAILLALSAAASCSQKGILWVHVLGDSTVLATPIEALRVEVTATRLNESHTTRYPATMGTIDLPTDFAYRVTGGLDDGDELVLDVFAEGGGMDLMAGSVTTNFDLRHVANVDVTLLPLGGCGDGTIQAAEDCDGANLGGLGCSDLGYSGGALACAGDCTFDPSGCTGDPCGNGVVDLAEDCDGVDLNGGTCASIGMGFTSGTLACAGDCTFDVVGCVLATCGDGTADPGEQCDGSDLAGMTCVDAGSFSGGVLGCTSGCAFDTSSCDGPPTVPVLRKPMNNSYLGSIYVPGSLRPTFVWEPSTVTGAATITYEIDYGTDPMLVAGTTTMMMTTPMFQPATDLGAAMTAPVGDRYYWRVRACAGSACSADSPTWWVNVGRSDHDVNGDGYADVIVGASLFDDGAMTLGKVYVFFGGSTPDTTVGASVVGEAVFDQLGGAVALAGDVNGDGFSDVVAAARLSDAGGSNAGRAYVYLGGAGAFDTTADGVLTGEAANDTFGISVSGAGDVNGDGYDDVIVGAEAAATSVLAGGKAYVFLGGTGSVFDTTPDGVLAGATMLGAFAGSVAGAGDVNGDGYADVIVGARNDDSAGTDAGRIFVYLGGAGTAFDVSSDATVDGLAAGDSLGSSVAGAGDVNGDGFADVIAGAPYYDSGPTTDAGRCHLFFGGPGTFDIVPDATLFGTSAPMDEFGISVAGAGDLNGDAFADVVVGAWRNDGGGTDAGRAWVYLGGAGTFDIMFDGFPAGAAGDGLGYSVSGAGDVNGDGFDDLMVGAPYGNGGVIDSGTAYLYLGGLGAAFDSIADAAYSGEVLNDYFGGSVASPGTSGRPRQEVPGIVGRSRRRWPQRPAHRRPSCDQVSSAPMSGPAPAGRVSPSKS